VAPGGSGRAESRRARRGAVADPSNTRVSCAAC